MFQGRNITFQTIDPGERTVVSIKTKEKKLRPQSHLCLFGSK